MVAISRMSKWLAAGLVLATGGAQALLTPQFIGCTANAYGTASATVTGTVSTVLGDTASIYYLCSVQCLTSNPTAKYSYVPTQSTPLNPLTLVNSACYCSVAAINEGDWVTTSTSLGCTVGNFAVYDLVSIEQRQSCYLAAALSLISYTSVGDYDPTACGVVCATYSYFLTGRTTDGHFTCYCANSVSALVSSVGNLVLVCGGSLSVTIYSHTATSSSTGGTGKKRDRLRREKEKRKKALELCPGGMTPCRISGVEAYECIDTSAELESCGGCLHGIFTTPDSVQAPANAITGTDCSAVPGIAMGAMTCSDGSCVASKCKMGWTLQGQTCVKKSSAVAKVRR